MVKKLLLSLCPLLSLFAATGQAQKNMEAVRDVVERYKECYAVKNISCLDSIFLDEFFFVNDSVVMGSEGLEVMPRHGRGEQSQMLHRLYDTSRLDKVEFGNAIIKEYPLNPKFFVVSLPHSIHDIDSVIRGTLFMLIECDDSGGKIPIVHIYMWQSDKVGGIVMSDDPMSFVINFYVPSK